MFREKNVVLILSAGGTGQRMGRDYPKQFIKFDDGKSILRSSCEAFFTEELCDLIDRLVVTSPSGYMEETMREVSLAAPEIEKDVVEGGEERQDSVMRAVEKAQEAGLSEEDIVVIHDAVRPFVTNEIIRSSVKTCYEFGAAVTAVPVKDTIRDIDKGTLERSGLYQVQTPQVFRLGIIREALEKAEKDGYQGTDDAGLVERLGIMPRIVEGSYSNIKITTPDDLKLAR